MASESEQNAAFHDQLAGHYDSHLTRPQDVLARASDNQIAALYRYNPARADLAHSAGHMEALYAK